MEQNTLLRALWSCTRMQDPNLAGMNHYHGTKGQLAQKYSALLGHSNYILWSRSPPTCRNYPRQARFSPFLLFSPPIRIAETKLRRNQPEKKSPWDQLTKEYNGFALSRQNISGEDD